MLKDILKDLNLFDEQIDNLNKLRELCLDYNKHINITNIINEHDFNIKHILDSLSINKYLNGENISLLDIGSGAGFPGLVIAIFNKNINVTMVDSNNKKTNFIFDVIKKLKLTNANVINERIEKLNIIEKFDFVVSRAVAPLNILVEISSFAAKINGKLIFYKGINLDKEMPKKWDRVEMELGIKFQKIENYFINKNINRKLIIFTKFKKTKEIYPRLYSTIKSKPIYN